MGSIVSEALPSFENQETMWPGPQPLAQFRLHRIGSKSTDHPLLGELLLANALRWVISGVRSGTTLLDNLVLGEHVN